MKIKLLVTLPVDEKHGCTKGRIYVAEIAEPVRNKPDYFIVGDTGETVGVFDRECEEVSDQATQ